MASYLHRYLGNLSLSSICLLYGPFPFSTHFAFNCCRSPFLPYKIVTITWRWWDDNNSPWKCFIAKMMTWLHTSARRHTIAEHNIPLCPDDMYPHALNCVVENDQLLTLIRNGASVDMGHGYCLAARANNHFYNMMMKFSYFNTVIIKSGGGPYEARL